jgi:SAM-dependent methyltransferase
MRSQTATSIAVKPAVKTAVTTEGLACPECVAGLRVKQDLSLECIACGTAWPLVNGVPHFIQDYPYWGEMSLEKMREVNRLAAIGPWNAPLLNSEDEEVRTAAEMILNLDRANWHWLTDTRSEGRTLDLGAGMGTISHALSTRFREVVAVEPVFERVEFMRHRFTQESISNVKLVRSSLWTLPFPAASFDLIAMNGVLEWIPVGREGNPQELQQQALNKAFDLLRPGGSLYVGIENRLPISYFIGAPDVHCGLPYVTVLPRRAANWYAKRKGHSHGYRNYLYSARGYRKLLENAGFKSVEPYIAAPSYNVPRFFLPMDETVFSYFSENFNSVRSGRLGKTGHSILARLGLLKYVQNSFALIAKK